MTWAPTRPAALQPAPNILLGMWAIVSEDRPIKNTMAVHADVKNGEENEEKRVATAATIPISKTERIAEAVTTCLSSNAGAARAQKAQTQTSAHGTTRKTREGPARSSASPRAATRPIATAATFHGPWPASSDKRERTVAASIAMKTDTVRTVPRYLPTRYSQRRMGRDKIGNIVLSSSSRYREVEPRTIAAKTPQSDSAAPPTSATTRS